MKVLTSYAELLLDPRWQKKRLEMMTRDNFTCQLCFDDKSTLHVHHKKYIFGRMPWEYEDDNFITYCLVCHKTVECFKESDLTPVIVNKIPLKDFIMVNCVYLKNDKLHIAILEYNPISKNLNIEIMLPKEKVKAIMDLFDLSETIKPKEAA